MNSREKILAAVKNNQPAFIDLPAAATPLAAPAPGIQAEEANATEFAAVLASIGGAAFFVSGFEEIASLVREKFGQAKRILSDCPELSGVLAGPQLSAGDPHSLADTDLAVLRGHFGVAENGAVWWTEEHPIPRVLPFICQHLALIIDKKDIVPTMREAYERIAGAGYDFGVFIAGPSKTADIEQSLVLGAHGPVSMTVFIMG
jgi:L-lactate dehydrogenase complex protein LldG